MNDDMLSDVEGTESQVASDDRRVTLTAEDFSTGGVRDDTPDEDPADLPASIGQAQPIQHEAQGPALLGMLRGMGYDPGDHAPADDYGVLQYLVTQAAELPRLREAQRQAEAYRGLGERVAPRAGELQQFLQKPPERKPYEPPPFDKRWAGMVAQDPATGFYVGLPGASDDVVRKANDFGEWASAFMRDPAAVIRPLVEERARAIVEETLAQRDAQQGQYAQVRQIAQANAGWFYARTQDNKVAVGIDGRPQISPLGSQYLGLVREAADMGVVDPLNRDRYARRILSQQADTAAGLRPQQQAATQLANQRQAHVLGTNRGTKSKLHRALDDQAAGPRTLAEQLRANFEADGITNERLLAPYAWSER